MEPKFQEVQFDPRLGRPKNHRPISGHHFGDKSLAGQLHDALYDAGVEALDKDPKIVVTSEHVE